jgi:hypothetical protein
MAGRKDKYTVDYFPHYCTSGKTIFILESKFGHTGYAIWFKTLELLGSSKYHYIDLRDETDLLFLISKMKITEQELNEIYDFLAKVSAIDKYLWTKKIVFSENFINNLSHVYTRRNNNCIQKLDLCRHLSIKIPNEYKKCEPESTKETKLYKTKIEELKETGSYKLKYHKHLIISQEEYKKLVKDFTVEKVDDILDAIDNTKDSKKYNSLYRTALNWLKRNGSTNKTHNISPPVEGIKIKP